MIGKRPKKVEKRKEFGHFEGDFIESGKDGKGSLLVLVERKTRYPFLIYTLKMAEFLALFHFLGSFADHDTAVLFAFLFSSFGSSFSLHRF